MQKTVIKAAYDELFKNYFHARRWKKQPIFYSEADPTSTENSAEQNREADIGSEDNLVSSQSLFDDNSDIANMATEQQSEDNQPGCAGKVNFD